MSTLRGCDLVVKGSTRICSYRIQVSSIRQQMVNLGDKYITWMLPRICLWQKGG